MTPMLGQVKHRMRCGTVTSGGTESIMLAMKTYRDQGREERDQRPGLGGTSHCSAALIRRLYFRIKMVHPGG
jgi:glutamate/tyrosine decarboxylase-like PLP-dependent enzyme